MTTADRVQAEVLQELVIKRPEIDSEGAKKLSMTLWLEDGRVVSIESSVQTVRHLTGRRAQK